MNRPSCCLAVVAVLSTAASVGCAPEVVIARSKAASGGTGGVAGSEAGGTGEVPPVGTPGGDGGDQGEGRAPRLLADSVADFSLTQGEQGWSYGYDLGSVDTFAPLTRKSVVVDYMPATKDTWECWAAEDTHWTQIFQLGAHPNGTNTSAPSAPILQRAVRRWLSTFAGTVVISGEVAKIDIVGSNGVDALIYVDGNKLYSTFIGGDDGGGLSYQVRASLRVGSSVDFVLDPHDGDDHHDLTRFTGVIAQDPTPSTTP